MPGLFVDTSGWASLFEQREKFHQSSRDRIDAALQCGDHLVTTNLVLIELTALLTKPLRISKSRQIQLLSDLQRDPAVVIVSIDSTLAGKAWDLWRQRPDKEWSMTDCASFVVMDSLGLREALTSDHHFEQAGFVRLLK